ncbi:zinc finger MYM-type 1-like [Pelobates cultripes]|uniref:Zinc finger MYM-type 1-like n=2 Tax=Pelobates cultripes TaxID=61616 RepID=A0AAD1WYD5_PELCU|nr:zinc finger MYM-type 1-like [Pelobates cultripes]
MTSRPVTAHAHSLHPNGAPSHPFFIEHPSPERAAASILNYLQKFGFILINMESKTTSKEKGGAQKMREKRSKELELAGRDPKQMKLSFSVAGGIHPRIPVDEVSAGPSAPSSRPVVSVEDEVSPQAEEQVIEEELVSERREQAQINDPDVFEDLPELECITSEDMSGSVINDPSEISFSLPPACSIAEKINFVEKHPFQPTRTECADLPFQEADFYYRKKSNGDRIKRTWLSCKIKDRKLEAFFCSICIAFSNSSSSFTSGCSNFRHCYQAANKHESSKSHSDAVSAYFTMKTNRSIDTLLNQAQVSRRKKEILQNIEVLNRIFNIVKLLGKQGLPFRAHGTNESLYNLNNIEINHGNFLEIVLLLSQYDIPLKNHLDKCVQDSEKRKQQLKDRKTSGKHSTGRGSLVTFLSNNTIKKVFAAIVRSMKNLIVSEIGEKRFSIQVDSTQDVGIVDQATVVVRYVQDEAIKERLVAILPVKDATGKGFHELLMYCFDMLGLDFQRIAGESFDGAANMRSAYVGLRAQIAKVVPDAVYIWCYSHILNLCVSDCCQVLEAKHFFGLLNRLATFIGDSHKRMNIWKDQLDRRHGQEKLLKLQKIGETRWWAKEKALNWIFGEKHSLYFDTLEVLYVISQSNLFESKTTSEASSLFHNLCQFWIILTANIFLQVFDVIGPVSKYLQTSGLDFKVAWQMVERAVEQLKKIDFNNLKQKAEHFAIKTNELMDESDVLNSLEVETMLPVRRVARKKRLAGESSHDERPEDEMQCFRASVFRPILDQIIQSMTERFSENKQLVMDSHYLDPRTFQKIRTDPKVLDGRALERISKLAKVNECSLKTELISFANLFPSLTGCLSEDETQKVEIIIEEEEEEEEEEIDWIPPTDKLVEVQKESKCGSCKQCFLCCHRLLIKYNLYSAAYENLSITYEYLLTLSFTQVSCERAFSKLKLIKTRLRATMGQELLDALMLMSVERDLLEQVQFPDVLEIIRQSSTLMRSLLTV